MINVYFQSMSNRNDLSYFLRQIQKMHTGEKFHICMASEFFSTPEVVVPCAGIIELLKAQGHSVNVDYARNALSGSGFDEPFSVDKNEYELLSPMFKVWRYSTGAEATKLVSAFVKYLDTSERCAKGVAEAFEWTTNEVMDNVLQHSKAEFGYVMCTLTRNAQISFAVYDNGIGIYKSFQGSDFRFKNPVDAITGAMKKEYTRDKSHNQGNGLWGMTELVLNNKGQLNITSSGAVVGYNSVADLYKGEIHPVKIGFYEVPGTLVDFQFLCNNEVPINEIFGDGYSFTNLLVEALEDDRNRIIIKVAELSFGYTTRDSGERARIYAINLATQTHEQQTIVIDFDGISIISSSFADEFIAKLVTHYGVVKFCTLFRVTNLKEINVSILNNAIVKRIVEKYESDKESRLSSN